MDILLDQTFPLRSFWTTKILNHLEKKWGHDHLTCPVSFTYLAWKMTIWAITTKENTEKALLIKVNSPSMPQTSIFLVPFTNHIPLISNKLRNNITEHIDVREHESTMYLSFLTRQSTIKGSFKCCKLRSWISSYENS